MWLLKKEYSMRTFHILFAFVALVAVMLGSYFMPNTPALWLTNGDSATQAVRLVLAGLLGAQLITTPPRAIVFRGITLVGSLFAISFGLYMVGGINSPIVDTLLFLQAGVALAITALEPKRLTYDTRKYDIAKTT